MAEKNCLMLDSVDLPRIRDAFSKCIDDLTTKTDFDVMHKYLNDTEIGKKRMQFVFILRGGDSSLARSQELYNGICKESDEYFMHWFNAVKCALSRTANQNNGKHQEVLEKIRQLQDAEAAELNTSPKRSQRMMSHVASSSLMSCKPKNVAPLKQCKKLKVILLGHSGSGKTRFFRYAIGEPTTNTVSTIGVDFRSLNDFHYQDTPIKITLWDTMGQETFGAITQNYYRGANGALIFVDLCRFKNPKDRDDLIKYTRKLIQDLEADFETKLPCLLVGAKYDMVKNLSHEEESAFTQLAETCTGSQWTITSAQDGLNVTNALCMIVEQIMNNMPHHQDQQEAAEHNNIRLSDNPQPNNDKKRKKCCT